MSTGLGVLEKENKKKSVFNKNNNSKVILFSSAKGGNGASLFQIAYHLTLLKQKFKIFCFWTLILANVIPASFLIWKKKT